jgi:Protein of unknown function (DUF3137)
LEFDLKGFESFYSVKLEPFMEKLKAECKAADTWSVIGILAFVLAVVILFFGIVNALPKNYGVAAFACFVLAVISYFKYIKKNDLYTDDYKESVIKEIINHISPGIIYEPDYCISEKEYKTSGLFRLYFDDFYGEDYMEGVYNNVSFHCSVLETKYEDTSTIFKGLFFVAKINSSLTGGTYVWSWDYEQLPVSIMDEEYRLMPMSRVVRVHFSNQSFNKYFSVCSTLPYQAKQILTPERIHHMVSFKELLQANIAFSFVSGHCYVAIAAAEQEDLLDSQNYQPDDKVELKKYYYTVLTVLDIIDQLTLSQLV